jgi:NADH dehydrogenase
VADTTREREPIVVDGATGYVGSHLAAKLCSDGHRVRCLVRAGADEGDVAFLKSLGAEVVIVDLSDSQADAGRAFAGAKAAVHLIGSIAPRKGESLSYLHETLTGRLVEHCQRNGVTRIIMVTALGTGPDAASRYHQTKWQAEELVRSSGLEYVILRPSLIVGRQTGRRDSKLVRRYSEIIRTRGVVPLINGGINRIQPVCVGDLVQALAACLSSELALESTVEIGGADVVTMREFVEALMVALAIRKPIIGLPGLLARAVAGICESLQPVPLLSSDQVTMAHEDNVCHENALVSVFGITPTPLAEALATYDQSRSTAVPEAVG